MLLNCGVGEDSWESLDCKEIQPVNPKGNQSWIFYERTDDEAETPILWPPDVKSCHLKSPWCWRRLQVEGEGDDRGWYGWMASPTQWTWVWVNSRSSWWTGRPGVLQSMGLQRVRHNWVTELNWTDLIPNVLSSFLMLILVHCCNSSLRDEVEEGYSGKILFQHLVFTITLWRLVSFFLIFEFSVFASLKPMDIAIK